MKKIALISLSVILILWWTLSSKPDKGQEEISFVQEPHEEKIVPPSNPNIGELVNQKRKIEKKNPPKPQQEEQKIDFTAQRAALKEKVSELTNKLEGCRKKVEEVVNEDDINEIETLLWQEEGVGNNMKRSELADRVMDKVGDLLTVDWHLEDLSRVTNEMMEEKFATSDPSWVLDQGGKLQPCGIYNTHRLFTIWTELVDQKIPGTKEAEYIEKSSINFAQNILNYKLGSSGVMMTLELMMGLSEKGYFDPHLRERLKEVNDELNEEMESRAMNIKDTVSDQSLVRNIVEDYKDSERLRVQLRDVLDQFYPINR